MAGIRWETDLMRSASLISPVLASLKVRQRKPKDKRDTSAWSRGSRENSLAGFSGLEQTVMSCAGTGGSQAGNRGLTATRNIDRSKVSGIARFVSRWAVRYQVMDRARVRNGAGSEMGISTGTEHREQAGSKYWEDTQDQSRIQEHS